MDLLSLYTRRLVTFFLPVLLFVVEGVAQELNIDNNSKLALGYRLLPSEIMKTAADVGEATEIATTFIAQGGEYLASPVDLSQAVSNLIYYDSQMKPFYTEVLFANAIKGVKLEASNENIFLLHLALLNRFDPNDSEKEKATLFNLAKLWEISLNAQGIRASMDEEVFASQRLPTLNFVQVLGIKRARVDVYYGKDKLSKKEFEKKLSMALAQFRKEVAGKLPDLEFEAPEVELQRVEANIAWEAKRELAAAAIFDILNNPEYRLSDKVEAIGSYLEEEIYFEIPLQESRDQLTLKLLIATSKSGVRSRLISYEENSL